MASPSTSAYASGMGRCSVAVAVASLIGVASVPILGAARPPITVEHARWQGHAWRLEAADEAGTGQPGHCYRIVVDFHFRRAAPPHSSNCTSFFPLPPGAPPSFPHGIAATSFTVCPLAFMDGLTVAHATQVVVTLADGKTVHTATVAPPKGLGKDVRYFAAELPCGSRVTKLVGLDASGRRVALVAT